MIGFRNLIDRINSVLFEQDLNGDNWYTIDENGTWSSSVSSLEIAQDHPILTPALLFVSNIFAQGRFCIRDTNTNEIIKNHWLIKLLNKPNHYQSRIDFLESAQFMKFARGKVGLFLKRGVGVNQPDSIYILDPLLIKYKDNFKTKMSFRSKFKSNETVIYDEHGENLEIRLKDIIFLYDLPNSLNRKNKYANKSRIDGLEQTLINTKDSLIAKNIILKSNGKEMLSADGTGGFPLDDDEKQEAEGLFNLGYGLSRGRRRALITKANVKWKSLHIALRDLGLDESVKVDGNIIYTALQIPKDILSLEAKKTTYNNFKESMTSYIQNGIQSMMNDLTLSFTNELLEEGLELFGSYDHMPVMYFAQKQKYDAISARAKALNDLLKTGVPNEVALEMCDFDKNLKLNERQDIQNENVQQGASEEDEGEEAEND